MRAHMGSSVGTVPGIVWLMITQKRRKAARPSKNRQNIHCQSGFVVLLTMCGIDGLITFFHKAQQFHAFASTCFTQICKYLFHTTTIRQEHKRST